jgi:transposase InsO family protein
MSDKLPSTDSVIPTPSWNSTQLTMRIWLDDLIAWLPTKSPSYATLLEHGYVINHGKVAVADAAQALQIATGTDTVYSIEAPSPRLISRGRPAPSATSTTTPSVLQTTTGQPQPAASAPTPVAPTTSTPSIPPTPLPSDLKDRFVIAPELIASYDRTLLETILSTINCVASRKSYALSGDGSGRHLLHQLNAEANSASASMGATLELMFHQAETRGINESTVPAFNEFYRTLDSLNRSLPPAQRVCESVMAEKLASAARRLGEHTSTLLDVHIAINKCIGNLQATIDAIRHVLSDVEARDAQRGLELSGGRTLVAAKRDRPSSNSSNSSTRLSNRNDADPKKYRPASGEAWSSKWRKCKHCEGQHWHRDCPKKPPAVGSSTGRSAMVAVTEDFEVLLSSLCDSRHGNIIDTDTLHGSEGSGRVCAAYLRNFPLPTFVPIDHQDGPSPLGSPNDVAPLDYNDDDDDDDDLPVYSLEQLAADSACDAATFVETHRFVMNKMAKLAKTEPAEERDEKSAANGLASIDDWAPNFVASYATRSLRTPPPSAEILAAAEIQSQPDLAAEDDELPGNAEEISAASSPPCACARSFSPSSASPNQTHESSSSAPSPPASVSLGPDTTPTAWVSYKRVRACDSYTQTCNLVDVHDEPIEQRSAVRIYLYPPPPESETVQARHSFFNVIFSSYFLSAFLALIEIAFQLPAAAWSLFNRAVPTARAVPQSAAPTINVGIATMILGYIIISILACSNGLGHSQARALVSNGLLRPRTGTTTATRSTTFIVDSGCSWHIHPHAAHLINSRPCSDSISGIDGLPRRCTLMGDMPIVATDSEGKQQKITLLNVRCVPSLNDSLLSVSQLWTELGADCRFAESQIVLTAGADNLLCTLPLTRRTGLFEIKFSHADTPRSLAIHAARTTSHIAVMSSTDTAAYMHRRLHAGDARLRTLPEMTSDAPASLRGAKQGPCAACTTANATHLPHSSAHYIPTHVGRLIHADIAGPFVSSLSGSHQYVLVFVDDHSRFKAVYFLKNRSQAPACIRRFIASFTALLNSGRSEQNRVVGTLHTDNAGEFLSREFTDILASASIHATTAPPHVHALNGVAERAIRAIMELARANLHASGAPNSFWDYAVEHAVDILNRTTGPPLSKLSAYEILTGSKPKIMSIMPFGCRAFAVKPRVSYSKTRLEPRAWVGIHSGRARDMPAAYHIWVPSTNSFVTTSDVYFDETLFPWRPAGTSARDDHPPAAPSNDDGTQPPGLPAAKDPSLRGEEPDLPREFQASTGGVLPALNSRKYLILFSGPLNRPDDIAARLRRRELEVECIDSHPTTGGGPSHDLLDDRVFQKILRACQVGTYRAIFASPPCSSFSVSRFFSAASSSDGGPPPIRDRAHPEGLDVIPPGHNRELTQSNELIRRTCLLLRAAKAAGSDYIIEHPADRGAVSSPIFLHERHAPLWILPSVAALTAEHAAGSITFPQCSVGAAAQKYTTLLHTAALGPLLGSLSGLSCSHPTHSSHVGGQRTAVGWSSADSASYPAELNEILSGALAALAPEPNTPQPEAAPVQQPDDSLMEELPTTQANSTGLPSPGIPPNDNDPAARLLDFDVAETAPSRHFQRSLGDYPLRNRSAVAGSIMLTRRVTTGAPVWGKHTGCVFKASASDPSPRTRKQAHAADAPGWTSAELKEIENHRANGSWTLIDRSELPADRRVIPLIWVYKVKRDGTLKARLCVQGSSQLQGPDFDQTFCAAMRGTSLRVLSSIAASRNLNMRRWDFVAAYLQGSLEAGEVIYCHPPQGYATFGRDGRPRVCRIEKPVYGMAQAGRRWQRTLFPWLLSQGFTQATTDPCIFILSKDNDRLIVGCYVDDLFVLYPSNHSANTLYSAFTQALTARWNVEDEGDISDLLNVEVSVENSIVSLTQTAYIDQLVATYLPDGIPVAFQANMTPADIELPALVNTALIARENTPLNLEIQRSYQSLLGALLYCSGNTRPDVAYAVGLLCRAMSCPTSALLDAAKRVLMYLSRHRLVGLRYETPDAAPVIGFSDSDWATKHSTGGYVFIYNQAAISWSSKKQTSVALSSCEAEIMAASEAAKEATYLRALFAELGETQMVPTPVHVDNKAAIDLSYNPEHHARTKHIDRRHFFVREKVEDLQIVVPFVRSIDNLADFFTKPLPPRIFFPMRDVIMNHVR